MARKERTAPGIKVFWFFFSKKNCFLASLHLPYIYWRQAVRQKALTPMARSETKVAVVTWMLGANLALTVVTLGVLITLASRIGEISGQIMHIGH
jgi:hypothetical protein